MQKVRLLVVYLVAIVALLAARADGLGIAVLDGPIDHIGLVVSDIETAAKTLGGLLGTPVPKLRVYTPDMLEFPPETVYKGSRVVNIEGLNLQAKNLQFELHQTLDDRPSLWADFLKKHGSGHVNHIHFVNSPEVIDTVNQLTARGGHWVLGAPVKPQFALVDMTGTGLGFILGLTRPPANKQSVRDAPRSPTALLDGNVDHIGLVVRDLEKSAKLLSELLGVPLGKVTTPTEKDIPFAPGYTGSRVVNIRVMFLRGKNTNLELVQPTDNRSSPWRDHLDRHGDGSVHHIQFNNSRKPYEIVRALEQRGARWTMGRQDSGPSYVDMTALGFGWTLALGEEQKR